MVERPPHYGILREDSSSVWGLDINKCLGEAPGEIGKYRYTTITKKVGNGDSIVGSGIWKPEEVEEIIKNSEGGKILEIYSFYKNSGQKTFIGFSCNRKVLDYLEHKKVLTRKEEFQSCSSYGYDHPFLFGEKEASLSVEIYNFPAEGLSDLKRTDYFKDHSYILMMISQVPKVQKTK